MGAHVQTHLVKGSGDIAGAEGLRESVSKPHYFAAGHRLIQVADPDRCGRLCQRRVGVGNNEQERRDHRQC